METDQAFGQIDQIAGALVNRIEQKTPHHRFGTHKLQHMRDLAAQAEKIGETIELDNQEKELLRYVLLVHDLGRHVEVLTGQKPKLTSIRHGYEGTWLLNRPDVNKIIPDEDFQSLPLEVKELFTRPILKSLSQKERFVINYATFWHAERQVPTLPANASETLRLANKICYLLRDMDKESLLADKDFFTPQGVYEQLRLHYFNQDELAQIDSNNIQSEVLQMVGTLLRSNQLPKPVSLPTELFRKITEIMNGGITEIAQRYFQDKETLPAIEIKYSLANYTMWRLAMIFDIHNPAILQKILAQRDRYLKPHLDFITLKTNDDFGEKLSTTIDDYITHFSAA